MWNEYARAEFSGCVVVHRNGVENEAEGYVSLESVEPFSGQVVHGKVASRTEHVDAQ